MSINHLFFRLEAMEDWNLMLRIYQETIAAGLPGRTGIFFFFYHCELSLDFWRTVAAIAQLYINDAGSWTKPYSRQFHLQILIALNFFKKKSGFPPNMNSKSINKRKGKIMFAEIVIHGNDLACYKKKKKLPNTKRDQIDERLIISSEKFPRKFKMRLIVKVFAVSHGCTF